MTLPDVLEEVWKTENPLKFWNVSLRDDVRTVHESDEIAVERFRRPYPNPTLDRYGTVDSALERYAKLVFRNERTDETIPVYGIVLRPGNIKKMINGIRNSEDIRQDEVTPLVVRGKPSELETELYGLEAPDDIYTFLEENPPEILTDTARPVILRRDLQPWLAEDILDGWPMRYAHARKRLEKL